jgi:hypothetical protein
MNEHLFFHKIYHFGEGKTIISLSRVAFLTSIIWKKFNIKKEMILKGFNCQTWERKKIVKIVKFYIWFLVCSHKYKSLITNFYFMFGL